MCIKLEINEGLDKFILVKFQESPAPQRKIARRPDYQMNKFKVVTILQNLSTVPSQLTCTVRN